ncbi:MAG: DUF2007 domain-containing protein [Phaeodactylibacter sp.]|nr:DUF2007 domain-containing protein [Phaeodactylibacter sp.]MCB9302047.1 DUF2007 domain-containing protein [Lewinellaceae bacterium]
MSSEQEILDHFEEFEENTRIVVVRKFFFESQASLYSARLKEAGIPNFISNANMMTALPLIEGGGIGLHIREQDLEEASRIVAQLDYQDQNPSPDEDSFHDADYDEIEFQKAMAEGDHTNTGKVIFWIVVGIVLLLILRAYLRAAGMVENGMDAF